MKERGGNDNQPDGHAHPFVAQKRLEMQARLEKRLRKIQKSEPKQSSSPANEHPHTLADGPPHQPTVPPPGEKISELAESVK